jgi:hypothetical protein
LLAVDVGSLPGWPSSNTDLGGRLFYHCLDAMRESGSGIQLEHRQAYITLYILEENTWLKKRKNKANRKCKRLNLRVL